MKKKEFKDILDYLFGDIPGIDTNKISFDDYNYEENMSIINDFIIKEEILLRTIFSNYDITELEGPDIDKLLSKLSSASILYQDLDEKYFYHEMLLNKDVISKIVYHKILKENRRYKINSILS